MKRNKATSISSTFREVFLDFFLHWKDYVWDRRQHFIPKNNVLQGGPIILQSGNIKIQTDEVWTGKGVGSSREKNQAV